MDGDCDSGFDRGDRDGSGVQCGAEQQDEGAGFGV